MDGEIFLKSKMLKEKGKKRCCSHGHSIKELVETCPTDDIFSDTENNKLLFTQLTSNISLEFTETGWVKTISVPKVNLVNMLNRTPLVQIRTAVQHTIQNF